MGQCMPRLSLPLASTECLHCTCQSFSVFSVALTTAKCWWFNIKSSLKVMICLHRAFWRDGWVDDLASSCCTKHMSRQMREAWRIDIFTLLSIAPPSLVPSAIFISISTLFFWTLITFLNGSSKMYPCAVLLGALRLHSLPLWFPTCSCCLPVFEPQAECWITFYKVLFKTTFCEYFSYLLCQLTAFCRINP